MNVDRRYQDQQVFNSTCLEVVSRACIPVFTSMDNVGGKSQNRNIEISFCSVCLLSKRFSNHNVAWSMFAVGSVVGAHFARRLVKDWTVAEVNVDRRYQDQQVLNSS